MLWVPENVRKVFVPNFIVMPLTRPELYGEDKGSVAYRTCWLVFGRRGMNIAEGLIATLAPYKNVFQMTGLRAYHDDATHYSLVERLDELVSHVRPEGLVIVVDQAHLLCQSRDERATQWLAQLPDKLRNKNIIVLLCCGAPTSEIPKDIRAAFQYQGAFHYTPPTSEWVEQYLWQTLVEDFRRFFQLTPVAQQVLQPISFELSREAGDLTFLAECCAYATTDELYGYCNLVKANLHRPRGSPPGTDPNVPIAFNLDFCKRLLKNVGGCLRVSEVNGYDAMQPFWDSAGQGYPDPPKPTPKIVETSTTRANFEQQVVDAFKEVPISNPYVEEEEEEPTKKRKVE